MSPQKTIAFHSYKGGTGKTTLIANIAALYAKKGFNVALLDFDLYAPSLAAYFRKKPNFFMNDILTGKAKISDVLFDLTAELELSGKFLVGFASSRKEDIIEIEVKHDLKWQRQALGRFLNEKREMIRDYKLDFIFLDTSPGIRSWSINALFTADYFFMLMKDSDMDIEGTRKMMYDIYDKIAKYGSKYYIILNKVPGATANSQTRALPEEKDWIAELERTVGAQVIGSIPCYCDVQFSRHEFLFSIQQPNHPFSTRISTLGENIKNLIQKPYL